jgi:hypothetical protein
LDYTKLRDLLAEQKFQDADDETRALLIKLAGPGAVDRKWVYFTEVSAKSTFRPLDFVTGRPLALIKLRWTPCSIKRRCCQTLADARYAVTVWACLPPVLVLKAILS